jgi:hypothetical protein
MRMMNVERDMCRSLRGLAANVALSVTQPVFAGADAADEAMSAIRPESIRGDMRFLSDDLLEGRGTATRGYELAATFVATQFETLGLQPAGDAGTYFQSVRLRSMKIDEPRTTLTWRQAGKEESFAFRQDYIAHGDPGRPESSVEAGVVFAGFGVTAPESGYDDYKEIDARGKIVALTFGAPSFETSLKAHYSSASVKAQNAVARGAIGIIVVDDPMFERVYPSVKRVRDLGLDFDAATKYARFVFLCGYLITEDPQRPTWNQGDFFGERYGRKTH